MSDIHWRDLTAEQQAMLLSAPQSNLADDPEVKRQLESMGLVGRMFQHIWLTDKGRELIEKEALRITTAQDSERGLWRVELIEGKECHMSRVAHSEDELAHLLQMAKDLKLSIELAKGNP